MVTFLKSTVR